MNEENQLAMIVDKSGLDKSKADVLLQNFQAYFKIAGEWEQKAKVLVVTNETQVAEMKMAREGRLFLKEKRVALEKTRKALKEQSLREGKAIDGIANVIKALIVPIEQHLDEQEHFVERREAIKEEALRLEVEARVVAERQAQEQWLVAEQEQVRLDNARLRKEAEAKEKQMAEERGKAEAEKRKMAEEANAERTRIEAEAKKAKARATRIAEKAAKEKAALEKRVAAEAEAKEREMKSEREKAGKILAAEKAKKTALEAKVKEQAKAERERLAAQIECPFCHKTFALPSGEVMARSGTTN